MVLVRVYARRRDEPGIRIPALECPERAVQTGDHPRVDGNDGGEGVKNKIILIASIFIIGLVIGWFLLPSFRIISLWEMVNIEDHRLYVLDWSVGGKTVNSATFYSEDARASFIKYLRRQGRVSE